MDSLPNRHDIHKYVEGLAPGTRVVWIPNGALGTIQTDKSILWDDGHHLTRREMTDNHALLIFSHAEKDRMSTASFNRVKCLQRGCKLKKWNSSECKEQVLEPLCPLAILTDPETVEIEPLRRRKARSVRTKPALSA